MIYSTRESNKLRTSMHRFLCASPGQLPKQLTGTAAHPTSWPQYRQCGCAMLSTYVKNIHQSRVSRIPHLGSCLLFSPDFIPHSAVGGQSISMNVNDTLIPQGPQECPESAWQQAGVKHHMAMSRWKGCTNFGGFFANGTNHDLSYTKRPLGKAVCHQTSGGCATHRIS